MLAQLKSSLLDADDAKSLQLEPFVEGHALVQPDWAGYKIPYFKPNGTLDHNFFRFRFLQDRPSKGWGSLAPPAKPRRYAQPKGSGLGIYLPPLLDRAWADIIMDPTVTVAITEGEKKAACACKHGLPTIGLGGVFNWRSAKELQDLIPALEAFNWDGRGTIICFDSDITTNPDVRMAAGRLAWTLSKRGAATVWATIEPGADGKKQGIDDLAFAEGWEAAAAVIGAAEVIGPGVDMHKMNCEAAVVRSTSEVVELATGNVYTAAAFADVAYRPRMFTLLTSKGMVLKPTAKEWLAWPLRSEVSRFEYEPGAPMLTEDGAFNTWSPHGWGCDPSADGDIGPWERLFGHVFQGCAEADRTWVRRWFAAPLRTPGLKLATAVLVWGPQQGTGKTLLGETMAAIYGKNYGTVTNDQLVGNFNEWAVDKSFVVGDELSLGDRRAVANKLKDMITRPTYRVNIKGRKTYSVTDRVNYYLTSNHSDAYYMESHDRRIFVAELNAPPLPQSFYAAYSRWLKSGGAARLFYYLANEVDMGDFDPAAKAPMTAAKADMTASGRGDVEDWCVQLASDPDSLLPSDRWPYDLWRTQDLLERYDPDKKERVKSVGFGRALGGAGIFKIASGQNNAIVEGARTRLWAVRNRERYLRMGATEASRVYMSERAAYRPGGVGASQKFAGGKRVQ